MTTETVLAGGLHIIGIGDRLLHAYEACERLIYSAPKRTAATDDLIKAVRMACARAQ